MPSMADRIGGALGFRSSVSSDPPTDFFKVRGRSGWLNVSGRLSPRGAGGSDGVNFRFQALFHFGPFRRNYAEVDAVAQAAGPGDDVMTENSFLPGAEAQNRVARLGIECVGFPF